MESSSSFPTGNAEALRSFVEGRERFEEYWGTRAFADLEQAHQAFERAERSDPSFALAAFYSGVAANELRRHDSAIEKLTSVAQRNVSFLPEAYLHLAYAYTKKYTEPDWRRAEDALNRAEVEAKARGSVKLLPTIESYRVFLYSVIGGRSERPDNEHYLEDAIVRGQRLLYRARTGRWLRRAHVGWVLRGAYAGYRDSEPLLVEVQNALGIAHMRKGQFATDASEKDRFWQVAEQFYRSALRLNSNVVRVLQNLGTLRVLQGDAHSKDGRSAAAIDAYNEARRLYQQTLDINPHDQFPHYRMAIVCAKLGDWDCALTYVDSGPKEPGSVRSELWVRLRDAIDAKDASRIAE